jgi:hypothetical protein
VVGVAEVSNQLGFTIGGVQFFLNKEDVQRSLASVEPENVREVYVDVNGKKYPIKQAFAQATGLLRGGFTTHDAMRVFRKLSLPVGSKIDIGTLPERFYTVLKSLNEFDKREIRGVVRGLIAKTDRDYCFIGNYYRAAANAESLLVLKTAKDLQAISMIARGMFELAVDVKLIDVIPDAVKKIAAFSDVEKLRAARKIVKFKAAHPDAAIAAMIHESFINNNAQRIEVECKALWPSLQKVTHWSGRNLSERVALVGAPFDELYELEYPRLSWYAHSGLTGFANLPAETFNMLAANQNKIAGESYTILLGEIIDEFGIEKADRNIKNKLKLAKVLPFTDSPEEARDVELELIGRSE